MDLTKLAEQYRLDINGVSFWTPYWINWDVAPYHKGAPFKGKGTPAQLRAALLRLSPTKPTSPEQARQQMRQFGLGIDCSGFVYHVLDGYLRHIKGQRLSDQLYVSRREVEQASHKASWKKAKVRLEEIKQLPPHGTLAKISTMFQKSPRMITNVARLTSPLSADPVKTVGEIKPADLIKMTTRDGDHIAIVIEVLSGQLRYAQSKDNGGLDGVCISAIKVIDPHQGLDKQDWPDKKFFNPGKGDSVWRLKALSGS